MIRTLSFLLISLLVPASASAQSIILEAENYVASHDEGGASIYVTTCSGASGGLAVDGYDYPGDWIEVTLNCPELAAYADSLRSAGLFDQEADHVTTVIGAGEGGTDLTSIYHTVGMGIG